MSCLILPPTHLFFKTCGKWLYHFNNIKLCSSVEWNTFTLWPVHFQVSTCIEVTAVHELASSTSSVAEAGPVPFHVLYTTPVSILGLFSCFVYPECLKIFFFPQSGLTNLAAYRSMGWKSLSIRNMEALLSCLALPAVTSKPFSMGPILFLWKPVVIHVFVLMLLYWDLKWALSYFYWGIVGIQYFISFWGTT